MNIRDLLNKIENIELNEGLRLRDIESQVSGEKDEQKRAQMLMTLAQQNKLPGLYDPVSGYFVSAEPDTQGEWQGAGTPTKPRISATGTEEQDALLAKRGLVPQKANTSTIFRHLNPFSSSNKDYDAGVQSGSQSAIAQQDKEDAELKQLTDLIPKYKALKDKLATLSGGHAADMVAAKGYNGPDGESVASESIAESLLESFEDLFEGEKPSFNVPAAPSELGPDNLLNTPAKYWTKDTAIVPGPNGEAIYDIGDLIFDIELTAGIAIAGTALAPFTAGSSELAAAGAAAGPVVRIAKFLSKFAKNAARNTKNSKQLKSVVSDEAKKQIKLLPKEAKAAIIGTGAYNAVRAGDEVAGTDVFKNYVDPAVMAVGTGLGKAYAATKQGLDKAYGATKHAVGLDESIASLKAKIAEIEEGALRRSAGQALDAAEQEAKQAGKDAGALAHRDPLQDILPPEAGRVSIYSKPPRPDITDVEWRTVPDSQKPGVWQWLQSNPKKSLAAALAATALAASQVGGGRGNVNPPIDGPLAAAPGTTPSVSTGADTKTSEPTKYQVKPGDNLSTIARRNNVSVAELVAANGIKDPNKIQAGAVLSIPPASGKPTYDQGVGSTPTTMPYNAPNPTKSDSDADAEAEDQAKKAEIEATQKEIDATKKQLADLIVDLEKSQDEDNIKQLQGLEAQLDDLEDIKALNVNNPSASNYTNQMDKASDAASAKSSGGNVSSAPTSSENNPNSQIYTNQMDRASDASTGNYAPTKISEETPKTTKSGVTVSNWNEGVDASDELQRWLKIARG